MIRIRQEDSAGRFRGIDSVQSTWRAASGHYLSREQCVIHTAEASLNSLQWRAAAWGAVGADGGHFGEVKERLGRGGRLI